MRQPLSIYVRAAGLSAKRFETRVVRKVRKLADKEAASSAAKSPHRPAISLDMIAEAIATLDIVRGDRVIVHSGIGALGKVAGGPKGVFSLLRDVVGDEGLLLFPAFPFDTLMYDYLMSRPSFDVRTAPAKMGAVVNMALADQDHVRSIHPTHSIAAFGREAKALVADHHLDDTPFGPRSPYWRLADSQGKVLVIGVGLSSVTGFHLPEDRLGSRFPVRVYHSNRFEIDCTDWQGKSVKVNTPAHNPLISRVRDCYLVENVFLVGGIYRKLPVGQHYVGAIDFSAMDACLQRLALEGRTIYGRIWG